eukprot:TRINITY_DN9907_c0_g1_i1.p1 TRINITY_DN9907_c0_g1~~TRINITY_DN9907_c0_g1_i1.p1  ORF type:complete len:720 (-),score=163.01 TRINITY_DN9907_c0_g1_i1:351-2510(-)
MALELQLVPFSRLAGLHAFELCSGSLKCVSRFSAQEELEVQRGCNLQTAMAVGALTVARVRHRRRRFSLRRGSCGGCSRSSSSRSSTVTLRAQGFSAAKQEWQVSQRTTAEVEEEDEPELRRWMQSKGCKGLELVRLRTDGKLGVWLRSEEVAKERDFLVVPRDCWISVPEPEDDSDQDIEEALAWKLLQERWRGQDSQYAPYVEFLWCQDLSQHPLFWSREELAWLTACPAAQNAVVSSQDTMERRAQKLEARACATRSAAQRESLSNEVRFALVLVECRAIDVAGVLESDPRMAALIPVMDHFRHNPTSAQSLVIGEEGGGPMIAQSTEQLMPGSELRSCFGIANNIELFSQYGLAPTIGNDSVEQELAQVEHNVFGQVELPVRVSGKTWKVDQDMRHLKAKLLAERAGLDFARTATGENAVLRLPLDGMSCGRMMPTARFLVSSVSTEEDCEALFEQLFANCHRSLLPETAGELGTAEEKIVAMPAPPVNPQQLRLEVEARQIAVEWCDKILKRYVKMVDRLSDVFEDTKGVAANSLQRGIGVESKTEVGEVTRAHFKAKSKDGSFGKSRKAKECRILSYSGSGDVMVQFLENGVRHSIPENWLVEATQATDRQKSGSEPHRSSVHRARALLAQELIVGEISVIESISDRLKPVLELGLGLLDPKKKDAEKAMLAQKLQSAWEDEYRMPDVEAAASQDAGEHADTQQQDKHVPELA